MADNPQEAEEFVPNTQEADDEVQQIMEKHEDEAPLEVEDFDAHSQ